MSFGDLEKAIGFGIGSLATAYVVVFFDAARKVTHGIGSTGTKALLLCVALATCFACNVPERTQPDVRVARQAAPVDVALVTTGQSSSMSSTDSSSSPTSTVRSFSTRDPVNVGGSLGRTFRGEMVLEISTAGKAQPATLRYLATGGKMRVRLDGSAFDFDLIAEGKRLTVIDHATHSFRELDLTELSKVPSSSDPRLDVNNELTVSNDDSVTFESGLRCEVHTITGPRTKVQTCVSSLPGAFKRTVFERATGIVLPAWLTLLLDGDQIPLRARGYHNGSSEFKSTVLRYTPQTLPEEVFLVPFNYAKKT